METPATPSLAVEEEKEEQRAEARIKEAEVRAERAEKKAARWKKRYYQLKKFLEENDEVIDVDSEDGKDERKPAAKEVIELLDSDNELDSEPDERKPAASAIAKRNEEEVEVSLAGERADQVSITELHAEGQPAASASAKRRSNEDDDDSGSNKKARAHVGIETFREEPETKEDSPSEEISEAASIEDIAGPFNALDETTQQWISAIGLEDGYGTGDEGLDKIETEAYVAPSSFEKVFLLADFLFPVEEGEDSHHLRLFERESRKGIKIRQKLRNLKKSSPDDELVCWHQPRQEWIPPNANALTGMVRLIANF